MSNTAKPVAKPVARKELTWMTPVHGGLKPANDLTLLEVSLASEILRHFADGKVIEGSQLTQVDYITKFIYQPYCCKDVAQDFKLLLIPCGSTIMQSRHLQSVFTLLENNDWGLLPKPEGFRSGPIVTAIVLDTSDLTRYAKLGVRSNRLVGDIDESGNRSPLTELSVSKVVSSASAVDVLEDEENAYDEDEDDDDDEYFDVEDDEDDC